MSPRIEDLPWTLEDDRQHHRASRLVHVPSHVIERMREDAEKAQRKDRRREARSKASSAVDGAPYRTSAGAVLTSSRGSRPKGKGGAR